MPYIKQEDRDQYDAFLNAHIEDLQEYGFPPGDVTYAVYKIVGHWFKYSPKYQTICEIRGMLAGVLSEFDRRLAFPYEIDKINDNGDVSFSLDTQCGHMCSSEAACEICIAEHDREYWCRISLGGDGRNPRCVLPAGHSCEHEGEPDTRGGA